MNVPNATESYILRWLILCDVNLTSIFKKGKNATKPQKPLKRRVSFVPGRAKRPEQLERSEEAIRSER